MLFIVSVWQRIRDLVIKLISVKGLFFLVSTAVFLLDHSLYPFMAFILSGSLFISFREIGKWKGLIKSIK